MRALEELCQARQALLVDFDGPVCRLFAQLPAPVVAARMLEVVPAGVRAEVASSDPLQVLRLVAGRAPELVEAVDEVLRAGEIEAAATAAPTRGAARLIRSAAAAGVNVVVVTNNCGQAVAVYLGRHGLAGVVGGVADRSVAGPWRMKPHRFLMDVALELAGFEAAGAVMIGNSLADVDAAHAAGVVAIGFDERPQRQRLLVAAEAVTGDLGEVAAAFAR